MKTTMICLVFLQPPRLNVFKNDQDTWDYTNPNLGGPGKTQMQKTWGQGMLCLPSLNVLTLIAQYLYS